MEEKLLEYLERIAVSLEKISQGLDKNRNILDDNDDIDIVKIGSDDISDVEDVEDTDISLCEDEYNNIISHLDDCGISIVNICNNEDVSDALKSLSLFMGNKYEYISDIYKKIKARLGDGRTITANLRNKSQEEISSTCQFCTLLYNIAFLSEYKYRKSPNYILYAKPNRDPKVINFLTGHWFELYVKTLFENEIINLISNYNNNIKWGCLSNPQIKLPNGDYFELDILCSVNGEIFWFEVKTGPYQDYISKYSNIADLLDIDDEHRFLVLMTTTIEDCNRLSRVFNMNVVSINNIKEVIEKTLSKFKIMDV
ncbi:MAG: hypothetical protein ACI3ZZ_01530 [Candidatus Aphodosoma sp.]